MSLDHMHYRRAVTKCNFTSRRAFLSAAPAAFAALAIPGAAYASARYPSLSREELGVIESTAAGFEEVYTKGGITLSNGKFYKFDLDALFDALDEGRSESKALIAAAVSPAAMNMRWDTNHFGRCLAKKIGIADVKAIIKAFGEPSVRRALKSRQWKKASAIAFGILKKVSPKLAKFLIKKFAHSLLPGGAVGALAFYATQCALGEL